MLLKKKKIDKFELFTENIGKLPINTTQCSIS